MENWESADDGNLEEKERLRLFDAVENEEGNPRAGGSNTDDFIDVAVKAWGKVGVVDDVAGVIMAGVEPVGILG